MTPKKSSVFISYAHKDGMEFTRRLAFSLDLYTDVFWDRRLQGGEFPPQLLTQIEAKECFVLVMSPYSLNSQWCRKELAHAQKHNKKIALARIYPDCGSDWEIELTEKYTYGDFTEDFNAGFRKLTQLILDHPFSPWEYYPLATDSQLLDGLRGGFIPAIIARGVGEWVLVEKLWSRIEEYIKARQGFRIFWGQPRTPIGILRQCHLLVPQYSEQVDAIGVHLVQKAIEIIEPFVKETTSLNDNQHVQIGALAFNVIENTKQFLELDAISFIDAYKLSIIRDYFDFEVAEKTREFINEYARRSRYLY